MRPALDAHQALIPRIALAQPMYDARELVALARWEYLRLKASWMPRLPAEGSAADGSAAVEMCLRTHTHKEEEHVEHGLFNIVTGSAEAMKRLHFSSTAVPGMASAEGAVVLIPGMTSALLLAHEGGSLSMPPNHSVEPASSPADQLTMVAVRVRADIPIHVQNWTSLQQALLAHQPQVEARVEAAPQAKRARTEDVPTVPKLWTLFIKPLSSQTIQVNALSGATLVQDLKQAIQDKQGASGSGQQEDEGQGQGEQEVIAERRQVIKAAFRALVEAARPDLSPEEVDAVVAELDIWDPNLLPQIKAAMGLLTNASVLEHMMRGPHHCGIRLLPGEVAVFEQTSSAWPVAKL
ncbi:hypothetical protein QJQ45_005363 [Haematococcus lacustris]|nr:hypothetical protein QJQ45_005363 [Haematococcus lacustris]